MKRVFQSLLGVIATVTTFFVLASPAGATVTALTITSPTEAKHYTNSVSISFKFTATHCSAYHAVITIGDLGNPVAQETFSYERECGTDITKTHNVAIPKGTPRGTYNMTVQLQEYSPVPDGCCGMTATTGEIVTLQGSFLDQFRFAFDFGGTGVEEEVDEAFNQADSAVGQALNSSGLCQDPSQADSCAVSQLYTQGFGCVTDAVTGGPLPPSAGTEDVILQGLSDFFRSAKLKLFGGVGSALIGGSTINDVTKCYPEASSGR